MTALTAAALTAAAQRAGVPVRSTTITPGVIRASVRAFDGDTQQSLTARARRVAAVALQEGWDAIATGSTVTVVVPEQPAEATPAETVAADGTTPCRTCRQGAAHPAHSGTDSHAYDSAPAADARRAWTLRLVNDGSSAGTRGYAHRVLRDGVELGTVRRERGRVERWEAEDMSGVRRVVGASTRIEAASRLVETVSAR